MAMLQISTNSILSDLGKEAETCCLQKRESGATKSGRGNITKSDLSAKYSLFFVSCPAGI